MEAIAVANAVSLSVSTGTAAVEEAASAADAAAASLQSDLMTPPAEAAAAVAAVPLSQSPLLALPDKLLLAVYSYLEMPAVTSAAATCSAAYCKVCTAPK